MPLVVQSVGHLSCRNLEVYPSPTNTYVLAVRIHDSRACSGKRNSLFRVQEFDLPFELPRIPPIVCVQRSNEIASGRLQSYLAVYTSFTVLLSQVADSRILNSMHAPLGIEGESMINIVAFPILIRLRN